MTETIKLVQKKLGVAVDGIAGKKTWAAIAKALGVSTAKSTGWPTQAEVRKGTSIFGKAGNESNLVNIVPPYPLYYCGKKVPTIRVHKLIAEPVKNALADVLAYYGLERIKTLGLDQYSGSYNYRKTSTGSAMSMHAWGIALDFAAEKNTYAMKKPNASLSKPECEKWWQIWESYGAVSLGREANYDWMHLQFAKLK